MIKFYIYENPLLMYISMIRAWSVDRKRQSVTLLAAMQQEKNRNKNYLRLNKSIFLKNRHT